MDIAYISIIGEVGEQVKLEDIVAQTNMHREAQELVFLISGPGGDADEGEAIANHINNLKQRTVAKNVGDVASIDANIYLACDHRIWDKTKGRFLIHNPWMTVEGDSSELKDRAEFLAQYENRIAKFISNQTGLDIDTTKSLMNKDDFLDNDNLVSLGIAHEIIESEFKAVAKLNKQKNVKMDNTEVEKKLGVIEALLLKIKGNSKPKAIILQDSSGMEIEFPEVDQGVDPVVGDKATVDGGPAQGEYVMPSGKIYVFEAGELMEIRPAEDETEALKQKITELENQLSEANATKETAENALAKMKEDTESLKVEFEDKLKEVKALIKSDTKLDANGKPIIKDNGVKLRVGRKQKQE